MQKMVLILLTQFVLTQVSFASCPGQPDQPVRRCVSSIDCAACGSRCSKSYVTYRCVISGTAVHNFTRIPHTLNIYGNSTCDPSGTGGVIKTEVITSIPHTRSASEISDDQSPFNKFEKIGASVNLAIKAGTFGDKYVCVGTTHRSSCSGSVCPPPPPGPGPAPSPTPSPGCYNVFTTCSRSFADFAACNASRAFANGTCVPVGKARSCVCRGGSMSCGYNKRLCPGSPGYDPCYFGCP